MKTTKNENLKEYVKEKVKEHIKENKATIKGTSKKDIKEYINFIFYNEMLKNNKMYEEGKVSRYNLFKDWIMGLCFISPIMEDLSPFTRFKVDYMQQEEDVLRKLISFYYIHDKSYFDKVLLRYNA